MIRFVYIHPGRFTPQADMLELEVLRKFLRELSDARRGFEVCLVVGSWTFAELLGEMSGAPSLVQVPENHVLISDVGFNTRMRVGAGELHDDGNVRIMPYAWSGKNCAFRRDGDILEDGQVSLEWKLSARQVANLQREWGQKESQKSLGRTAWDQLDQEDPWG